MPIERIPDWSNQVATLLRDRAAQPFAWGINDCALFAADVVQAATGTDFAKDYRGRYRSKRGAALVMRSNGWADLADMVDAFLPRRTERPRRGDVVLYAGKHGDFLGIVWSGGVMGPDARCVRLWAMDPEAIRAVWSVG